MPEHCVIFRVVETSAKTKSGKSYKKPHSMAIEPLMVLDEIPAEIRHNAPKPPQTGSEESR